MNINVQDRLEHYRLSAKKRNISFELTEDNIKLLYSEVTCPITGETFKINNFSVDRVDSSLGYVPGNVIPMSCRHNIAKANYDNSVEINELIIKLKTELDRLNQANATDKNVNTRALRNIMYQNCRDKYIDKLKKITHKIQQRNIRIINIKQRLNALYGCLNRIDDAQMIAKRYMTPKQKINKLLLPFKRRIAFYLPTYYFV